MSISHLPTSISLNKRILIFTTAYRPLIGGSEIALEEMVRHLPDIFFDIVTPRHRKVFLAKECGNNFCIYRTGFGFGELLDKLAFPCLGALKAFRLMSKNKYTAVHAYQASYGGGAAWLVKTFFTKTKFILTLQEGKDLDKQNRAVMFFRNLMLKKADAITAISVYLADFARGINPKAKISVIPNGVDLKQFSISNNRAKPSSGLYGHFQFPIREKEEKVIITVSRLVPKNGIGDLVNAMDILVNSKWKMENIKLLIIGDGPLREKLKSQITNHKLEDNVELLGEVPPDKIPQYLANADVFVRPSLSEGLGISFLEAMAAGLPIIGTQVGGIPDFLKDGETGLFCRVGDPEDIADKIIELLGDNELRTRLVKNSRRLVEEKYDWNKIVEQFRRLYLEISN